MTSHRLARAPKTRTAIPALFLALCLVWLLTQPAPAQLGNLRLVADLHTLADDTEVYSGVRDGAGKAVFSDLLTTVVTAGPSQPKSLYARFVVLRPEDSTGVNVKHMAEGRIHCFDAAGGTHSYVTTTQNIWVEGSRVTMVARLLLVPSAAGTYTCVSRARADKCASGETSCTARYLLFLGGVGNTELSVSSPTWAMAWGLANDVKHPAYTEAGVSYVAATHVHADIPPGDYPDTGNEEYVAKGASFLLPADLTTLNAISGVEMTSCFRGDTSCFPGARAQGGPARDTTSVVDLYMLATQYDAAGAVCVQTTGPTTRLTILGDSHHQKANIVFNGIPINPACGSRRFSVKTYVQRVSGNPVRIERGDTPGGGRFNGFSLSGVYAT